MREITRAKNSTRNFQCILKKSIFLATDVQFYILFGENIYRIKYFYPLVARVLIAECSKSSEVHTDHGETDSVQSKLAEMVSVNQNEQEKRLQKKHPHSMLAPIVFICVKLIRRARII